MALLIINLDKVIGSAKAFRDAFKSSFPICPFASGPMRAR